MRGLPAVIRLRQFQLEEKRRALAQLQGLRTELDQKARDLEAEVTDEQRAAAMSRETVWTYAAYAQAVIERRANLKKSLAEVDKRIEAARHEVADAYRELRKYEMAEERAQLRAAAEAARREQQELDEIALTQQRLRAKT